MCLPKPIQFKPEETVLIDKKFKNLRDKKIIEKVKNSDTVTEPARQSAPVTQNETYCFWCFRQSCKKHIGRRYRNIPLLVEKIDKETIFIISIKMDFFVSKNKLIYLTQM